MPTKWLRSLVVPALAVSFSVTASGAVPFGSAAALTGPQEDIGEPFIANAFARSQPEIRTAPATSHLAGGTPRQKPAAPPISSLVSDTDYVLIENTFDAIAKRRWSDARSLMGQIEDDVARDVLLWTLLTRSNTDTTFGEVLSFAERRSDWPRFDSVLALAEETLPKDMPADEVIAWFAGQEPVTGEGKLHLGEAYLALGQTDYGLVWINRAWVEHNFSTRREKEILRDHRKEISQDAQDERLRRLMWQRQFTTALRTMPYASNEARSVAETQMRIHSNPRDADREIRKLPKSLRRDPAVLFEEIHLTRRLGKDDAARGLLLSAPGDAEGMGNPEKWWRERHLQARKALKDGAYQEAYDLAANNGMTEGAEFAEAEFLAGWLALQFLKKPDIALRHFERLETGVSFPISISRARYWQGRAQEDLGNKEAARQNYLGAGEHPYTYYGQLALAHPLVDAPALILPDQDPVTETVKWSFENQDFVRAIRLLDEFDRSRDVRTFFYYYAGAIESRDDYVLLADLAQELDYTHYAIRVAKKAIQKNIALVDYSYPIRELPAYEGKGEAPDPAIVFGLSRQESEFNPRAVSSAGARGLMQLMPATARITANKHGLPYQTEWLLDDPTYNTQLGMAHLSDVIDRFDGSYIMTIAAYNAGAARVDQWIIDYGDPRDPDVDPIDWVESIPFKETRNYVQRVLENTQVYRNRLAGRSEPIQIVEDLSRTNRKKGLRLPLVRASVVPVPDNE